MSTGAECRYTEVEPGRWSYWLQDWPYGDSPNGETFGPFRSFQAAHAHCSDNHANPGGYTATCLKDGRHVHEWTPGAYVQSGVTLQVTVESLGPDPSLADVVRLVQALPVDHGAFRFSSGQRWDESLRSCASCGERP